MMDIAMCDLMLCVSLWIVSYVSKVFHANVVDVHICTCGSC